MDIFLITCSIGLTNDGKKVTVVFRHVWGVANLDELNSVLDTNLFHRKL